MADTWGLTDEFLEALRAEKDKGNEPDYEGMADSLAAFIAPLYQAFVDRGVDEAAAVDLTLGMVQVFGQLGGKL